MTFPVNDVQILLLKLLVQHSDLLLQDEPPLDPLLVHFVAHPAAASTLPLLQCLLLKVSESGCLNLALTLHVSHFF